MIDPQTGVVVQHIERWKADPGEVVARLLKPSARVPTNSWETFMLSASAGDVAGCWMVVSGKAALAAAPVVAVAAVTHVLTGEQSPADSNVLPGPSNNVHAKKQAKSNYRACLRCRHSARCLLLYSQHTANGITSLCLNHCMCQCQPWNAVFFQRTVHGLAIYE